ncbi:hypothetical protein FB107DRAFT_220228 [Schizophyllum commune]
MGCHPSRTSTINCLEDGGSPADCVESCSLPHDHPTVLQPVRTPTDPAIEDDAKPPSINNQYVEDEEPLIHHLPIELLSEIFRLCGDPSTVTDILSLGPVLFPALTPTLDFGRHTFLASVFALQQVCRRWHHLARALPELWTQLDFGHRLPADPVRVAEVCIERAGALPLTLRLRQTDSCAQAACGALLEVVAENPGRWRQLVVEVRDGDAVLRPVLACADASMTELQVAVIRTVLPWGQAQGSCKIDVLAKFHSHFPGLRLMHNSIHLYLYLAYGSMLYTQSSSSLKAFDFVLAHYSVSVPGNRAVSRMTIEFATPLNGNGRMSRGREHPDSDSDTQNVSTAPRATPTHIDATPVMIEHSHLPSRLRALRNYLVHRLARDSSRHVNAETYAATNEHATSEPNSPETTPKVRSNNESTSTSDSSSAFATELIVEASDVGRHTAPERALRQMQEHLSARLDGVERGPPYTSPLSSFTNPSSSQSPKYDGNLPETKAADGHNGIFSAPRAGHASPARALPGLPSVRDAASRTLASNARHVPLVSPRPACAPPPHSPPGLQSYRRQSRTGANNGRNGPPVTPTSLNFSGQSIANSPPFMLETRDGTLPEGVSNGVPTSSLQASGGATPTALGPYPSQPLGGVQDGANATSSQPHDDLDDSMPPAPSQLPIPLPDVEEHDDDAAPPPLLRVPVPLPDIGEPEIKLSPPRVPDPVLESHDFGCDDSNALDLHLTHSEPPNLLPRLENHHRIPNPVMVYDDSETDLARERARARLLRLLYESNRSSSPFKYDLQRKPASPIPAGLSGFDLLDHGPFSPVISPCLPPRTPNIRSPAPTALAPEGSLNSSTERPTVAADVDRPPVPTSVPTAVMLSIRTFDPATMPATRGSTTSDKEKHDIPTYIGGLKVSRTCAGLRLVIDVDTPDRSKPSCSTYFYGGFELAMESLRGVLEVDGRPHNLTELSLRINRLRDRKDHDIMMTVVSQLGDFLRYFHLVDIHMQCADKIDWTVDLCAVRHKFGQLRHLRISGAAWSQRFECFPLDRIAQLDVMVPITVPDILELLRRTEKLNFLVLHFVQGREDLLKQHTKGKEPKHQNLPRALHVKCQGNISAELLGVLGRAHAGPTADVRLFVDQPVPMEVVSLFAERHWSLAITK